MELQFHHLFIKQKKTKNKNITKYQNLKTIKIYLKNFGVVF